MTTLEKTNSLQNNSSSKGASESIRMLSMVLIDLKILKVPVVCKQFTP